jgi:carbon storage regulator
MLVLNRKTGERVMIGHGITITVLKVHGDRVQLGFDCPEHIPVHREEVYNRIQAECRPPELPANMHASPYFAEFA